MNSAKEDRKPQAQPKKNGNPTSLIEDFFKQFRKGGITALAHLDKDEQTQVINWARDIVNRYGSIIKENPMKIKNAADLPCLKEDLKIAIKVLLPAYISKGSDDVVDLLRDRYVRLSAFQEISQKDKDRIMKEAHRIDHKTEYTETALFPTYHKYMEIIVSEQKILLDEVNAFISDLQME